jgi:WD40 repeat protein
MLISESAETNGQGRLSPSGKHLVLSKGLQIKLYSTTDALKFLYRWQVLDETTNFEWSRDSCLILCGQHKRGIVQLFSAADFSWSAVINPGVFGISHSFFAADSRNVLTVDQSAVRVTVWGLLDQSQTALRCPKFKKKGFSWASNGKKLAVLCRENFQDTVFVFSTLDWTVKINFVVEMNASDLFYMPDGSGIVVIGSEADCRFKVFGEDGQILKNCTIYENAPGISKFSFTQTGNYLAISGFDNRVRIYHYCSWVQFHEFNYAAGMAKQRVTVIKESEGLKPVLIDALELGYIRESLAKPSPTVFCLWSMTGKFLVTVLKVLPNIIWVWELESSGLFSVIIMKNSVQSAVWTDQTLVWTSGDGVVYVWNDNQEVTFRDTELSNIKKIEYNRGRFLIQNKAWAVCGKID